MTAKMSAATCAVSSRYGNILEMLYYLLWPPHYLCIGFNFWFIIPRVMKICLTPKLHIDFKPGVQTSLWQKLKNP